MTNPNDDAPPEPAVPVRAFYEALAASDADGIATVYAPDVVYSDPVFGRLVGDRALLMWRMFCARDDKIGVDYEILGPFEDEDGPGVRAKWTATYSFGNKGRPVVNDISSEFRLRDGLISAHHDSFSVRGWAKQAIGPIGWALSGVAPFRKTLHKRSTGLLDAYQQRIG